MPVETLNSSSGANTLAVAPFMGHTATLVYRGQADDLSTLVQNSGGTWTHTYPDGTVIQFNSGGPGKPPKPTSATATHSITPTYRATPACRLQGYSDQDPVGLITTLSYSSGGTLSTVLDPASRLTTFIYDAHDNLVQITDPDGAITTYGYSTPTNHQLTTETDPDNYTATAHYNSFGQLASETLFDNTSSTSIVAAQSVGLLAAGSSGSLPTSYYGTVNRPGRPHHYRDLQLEQLPHRHNRRQRWHHVDHLQLAGLPDRGDRSAGATSPTYSYDSQRKRHRDFREAGLHRADRIRLVRRPHLDHRL